MMKSRLLQHCQQKNTRGAVLPLVGVLLVVFIGIAAFAIDIGYISTTKNELQNVADAAALAATSELGQIYLEKGDYIHSTDFALILKVVDSLKNQAAQKDIKIASSDVIVGTWVNGANDINGNVTYGQNAVKVIARREKDNNDKIVSLFAGIFGSDSFALKADAIAALTGQANLEPGEVKLPFALSMLQFPNACQNPVHFNSNNACAAWHTYTSDSINAEDMENLLYGTIRSHSDGYNWLIANIQFPGDRVPEVFNAPQVIGGTTSFSMTEGVIGKLFTGDPSPMQALFNFWKTRDKDGDESVWTTTVPVYKETSSTCTPANQKRLIVGAADIIVTGVNGPPSNSINVIVDCSYKSMRGSGGIGGNVGTIPNLVR